MQDIYAFDVGDFGKLGLLRHIVRHSGLRLGVMWWRTELGSAGEDGRHTDYLKKQTFRCCDPELWEEMGRRFDPENRKIVDLQPLLPRGTVFHGVSVPPPARREQWLNDAMVTVRRTDLVFCDPDNGICSDGVPRSLRHVYDTELAALFHRGHSVVVYHTPSRASSHATQVQASLERFRQLLPGLSAAWGARFRRGTSRVLFVLAQEAHQDELGAAIRAMQQSEWTCGKHFDFHA